MDSWRSVRGGSRIRAAAVTAALLVSTAVPAAVHASVWSVQPTPNLPTAGSGSELGAVSCVSSQQCVAVGAWSDYTPEFGLAEVYGPGGWIPQDASAGISDDGSPLLSVSCPAVNDCYAVGYDQYFGDPLVPVAEHWDGTSWTAETIEIGPLSPRDHQELTSVSCSAPTTCTAVGSNLEARQPLIERLDGTVWKPQRSPKLTDEGELTGVSCTAIDACTAVGDSGTGPLIERWNGGAWSVQQQPVAAAYAELTAVSCIGPELCTAVGYAYPSSFAERSDLQGGWKLQAVPTPAADGALDLTGVACTELRCVAVGSAQPLSGNPTLPIIEVKPPLAPWHVADAVVPAGMTDAELNDVACPTFTRCVAVGASDDDSAGDSPLAEVSSPRP